LVHLVGDLGDDDRLAIALPGLLHGGAAAHDDLTAARLVRTADALAAHHEACGGEVRPGHELHEVGDGRVRVVDEVDGGVQHLAHVVGRDVGGHADRDAGGPVHQ